MIEVKSHSPLPTAPDPYPQCAFGCRRRASGGVDYVDSLVSLSAPLGINYTGVWADASTLVVTVLAPHKDVSPRRYDTILSIPEGARITNLAGTSDPLSMPAGRLRFANTPTPPKLVSARALDFENANLEPGACGNPLPRPLTTSTPPSVDNPLTQPLTASIPPR